MKSLLKLTLVHQLTEARHGARLPLSSTFGGSVVRVLTTIHFPTGTMWMTMLEVRWVIKWFDFVERIRFFFLSVFSIVEVQDASYLGHLAGLYQNTWFLYRTFLLYNTSHSLRSFFTLFYLRALHLHIDGCNLGLSFLPKDTLACTLEQPGIDLYQPVPPLLPTNFYILTSTFWPPAHV